MTFPNLLSHARNENQLELDSILGCGLPWLRLDLICPQFSQQVLDAAVTQSTNWRSQWNVAAPLYQVRNWNGQLLFGPEQNDKWDEIIKNGPTINDEDAICKKYRQDLRFAWRVDSDHPVRQWVNTFLDDADINIVNYYVLPPGGYLHPHYDPCAGNKWLNKIYVAIKWPLGAELGFLDWGNVPIQETDVLLINNYLYPHWALNNSTENRIVLDIGCNLDSIQNLIKQSFLKR